MVAAPTANEMQREDEHFPAVQCAHLGHVLVRCSPLIHVIPRTSCSSVVLDGESENECSGMGLTGGMDSGEVGKNPIRLDSSVAKNGLRMD